MKAEDLGSFRGDIESERPNASLYTFNGNMQLQPPLVQQPTTVPLSPACVVLRGRTEREIEGQGPAPPAPKPPLV